MWIVMKQTLTGKETQGLGLYPKGLRFDLPESYIKVFPEGSYEKCPAPWDVHKAQPVEPNGGPAEPEQPVESEQPAEPEQPVEPEQLVESEQPAEPEQPVESEPAQEGPSDAKEKRAKSPKRQPPKKR